MPHYIVPYACGVNYEGIDDVGGARCDKALKIAAILPDAVIMLGAGMPEVCQRYGFPSLAEVAAMHLERSGWSRGKTVLNPKGFNTLTETEAVIESINKLGAGETTAVTLWHHAPRVWLTWWGLRRPCRVKVIWHMPSRRSLKKAFFATFRYLFTALRMRWAKV